MDGTELGRSLLTIARRAIAMNLGLDAPDAPEHESLQRPSATFVTLRRRGELRGCIGSLEAVRALGRDVHENAIAAAFRDPRFEPLSAGEYPGISIEVSLLSACEPVAAASEEELLSKLRPGIDGLVLEVGYRRATFLPAVWEMLEDPKAFVAALKQKAGLPAGFWSDQMRASRYGVTKWAEGDAAPGSAATIGAQR